MDVTCLKPVPEKEESIMPDKPTRTRRLNTLHQLQQQFTIQNLNKEDVSPPDKELPTGRLISEEESYMQDISHEEEKCILQKANDNRKRISDFMETMQVIGVSQKQGNEEYTISVNGEELAINIGEISFQKQHCNDEDKTQRKLYHNNNEKLDMNFPEEDGPIDEPLYFQDQHTLKIAEAELPPTQLTCDTVNNDLTGSEESTHGSLRSCETNKGAFTKVTNKKISFEETCNSDESKTGDESTREEMKDNLGSLLKKHFTLGSNMDDNSFWDMTNTENSVKDNQNDVNNGEAMPKFTIGPTGTNSHTTRIKLHSYHGNKQCGETQLRNFNTNNCSKSNELSYRILSTRKSSFPISHLPVYNGRKISEPLPVRAVARSCSWCGVPLTPTNSIPPSPSWCGTDEQPEGPACSQGKLRRRSLPDKIKSDLRKRIWEILLSKRHRD